jgi:hypothetical protein
MSPPAITRESTKLMTLKQLVQAVREQRIAIRDENDCIRLVVLTRDETGHVMQ